MPKGFVSKDHFKNRVGVDKRIPVLMASTMLRDLFLDKWYELDQESYNFIYDNMAEVKAGKSVKGITLIAQLSDNFPRTFNKVWNRKPFKDLDKTIKAYDGPLKGYDPSMPGAVRVA